MKVTIDNRLRVAADAPNEFVRLLKERTTHKNPDHARMRGLGLWAGQTPAKIQTWRQDEQGFSLPRGATNHVREVARHLGLTVEWSDRRVSQPVSWPEFRATPRDYQLAGIEQCCKREQGIVRAPTGCISGDAQIRVEIDCEWTQLSLEELVADFNHGSHTEDARVLGVGDDYKPCWTPLVAAYASGERLTYRVTFEAGHVIRATASHWFARAMGTLDDIELGIAWLPLSEVRVGDRLWVHDPTDSQMQLSKVVAIEEHGLEQTYDLSCGGPNNFLANGVLVHNSGKTLMALAALPRLGERALVIVRDRNLLEQWVQRARENFGMTARDIGLLKSGTRRVGSRLTLGLQQTLYSKKFDLAGVSRQFGAVIVDEVHDAAARTVGETVDAFAARVRLGFSADHRRRDRKEFIVEDLFGRIIFEVGKQSLEETGAVVPVVVRLVPTKFRADWYADAPSEERDFTRLISEMTANEERCRLVRQVVVELVAAGSVPALVFTHRREHASRLAEVELPADGVPAGLLLGSTGNAEQFHESKTLLLSGDLRVAVGTFKSVGQGIDIPNVLAGVCATPIGANRQFFGQVRGRICRVVPGKKVGHLYYLWDRLVFPEAARNLLQWNDGLVEIFDYQRRAWVAYR